MAVIFLLPVLFPAINPIIKDFFSPFLPERPFVSEMTLKQENQEFRRQLTEKTFNEKELLRLRDENKILRSQLSLKKSIPYKIELMEVLERHPINWNYGFSILNHNTALFQSVHGVLIDGNLVGLAKAEGKKSFRVKTFLNHDVELAVNVRGTNWDGLIRGEFNKKNKTSGRLMCLVDYLPRDAEIRVGMIIQSAGVGSVPRGLPIARVVGTEKDEVVQRAEVELLADIAAARYVGVIVEEGQ